MNLNQMIKDLDYINIENFSDVEITNIQIDSRKVTKNSLYVAIKGTNVDGHIFIKSAFENGAIAVICEENINIKGLCTIKVCSARIGLSTICKNFYLNPTKDIDLIGVTGTNGKTSITYFLEQVFTQFNKKVGVIGTIGIKINGDKLDYDFATSTTPDTIQLNEIAVIMKNKGVEVIAIEVSSHSLELNKVSALNFDVAIFTNLTQDHLDMHKNMQNYRNAKAKLFKMCKTSIINADDKYKDFMIQSTKGNIITYSIHNESDLQAINIQYFMDKVEFDIKINDEIKHFILNVPAKFSVYNALAVIGASIVKEIPINIIQKGIENIKGVLGRIQTIKNDKGFNVIVDYAHTPDGLDNIIKAVKQFTKGKVITVFGCGGDRDTKKRPIMGKISAKYSGYTIITSDNPRSENPTSIVDEIEKGVLPITTNYEKIVDRKEAIYKAIKMAKVNDSIIIAGKGHEDYEIFADRIVHFDDSEVAKEALEDL